MRKVSILGLAVAANFATAGLGRYIDGDDGKLAISNLTPVLFLALALPLFIANRPAINRNIGAFILGFNAFGWLSFLIFAVRYSWEPNIPVLFFQEVEIVFCLLLIWYARRDFQEFRAVAKFGTICSAIVSAGYGVQQVLGGTAVFLPFGMDDKSQVAVLFCCQAFILLRYFPGILNSLIAGLLLIFSFLTLSRLPVFFMPIIMLAIARRSRYGAIVVTGLTVAVIGLFVVAGDAITTIFKVFDRLASLGAIEGDSATSAHLLLLQSSLQMKFTDAFAFLFGVGPGNFAKALTTFPLSLKELNAVDPTLVHDASIGRAPMHSTPFSALLDYSMVIFCLLGILLMQAVRYLMVRRYYMELMFFSSLFAASMFYSLHNKPYFFLMIIAVYLLMSAGEHEANEARPLVAGNAESQSLLAPGK
jgi:hypothetical protein